MVADTVHRPYRAPIARLPDSPTPQDMDMDMGMDMDIPQ